jgi:class 3 adenylate cyclase/DNA-binding response OmpR family regulator/predicted ATPase
MRSRILIVARDVALRARLARLLGGAGHRVELAESAVHARRIDGFKDIDLAIVAPDGLGPERDTLAAKLRAMARQPLLLAAAAPPGRPKPGPEAGRGDALDPADEDALLARVDEALRRPARSPEAAAELVPVLRFAGYSLNLAGHGLTDASGAEIPLTRGEFGLLREFVRRPGRVLSRNHLLGGLTERETEAFDRSVDMLVSRLRRKVEPDPKRPTLIVTVPGSGYKFTAGVTGAEPASPVMDAPRPDDGSPPADPAAAVVGSPPPASGDGASAAAVPGAPSVRVCEGVGREGTTADAAIAPEREAGEAERRQVTVLCCDLVGSTALSSRLDPEDLRELLVAYHRRAAEVIARWAGRVANTMGDGVLAYFGHPSAHEDDAERAVQAGLELIDAVRGLAQGDGPTLELRVGIATGLVVIEGTTAAQGRGAVGETPNLAARLQALAPPGSVVIAATTRALIGGLFEYEDLGPQWLKGWTEPLPAWRVLGESATESRFEALRAESRRTRLFGREEELELLLRRWQRARTGEGQAVLLTGEAGIGKSRLAAAVREAVAGEACVHLSYFCSPRHQDSALHPVIAQLRHAAGFELGESAEARWAKLEALLGPTRASDEDVALLGELLSLSGRHTSLLAGMTPQKRRERTIQALLRQLTDLARQGPVLALFEDVHWADPSTRDLLDRVIGQVADHPVLLVLTFRPEFQPPWAGLAHVTSVLLNRLDRRGGAALVREVASRGKALRPELVEEIIGRADGVPLFLEELTKAVLEAGLARADAATLAIPSTLHDSLMARLDRLAPVKEVAQIASVIGREFGRALLAAVANLPEAALDKALARLVAAELVFPRGGDVYLFKHALVHDAAYRSLLRGRRQVLQTRVAEALEECFPEVAATTPEVLANHFTEAGQGRQAVAYWLRAGQRAAGRSALVEAVAHLTRGVEALVLLPEGDERDRAELELQTALGTRLMPLLGWAAPEVEKAWTRARELCERLGDAQRLLTVLWGQSTVQYVSSRLDQGLETATELLQLGQERDDPRAITLGHRQLGHILTHLARFGRARWHLEQASEFGALTAASAFADHIYDPVTTGRAYLARCLLHSGYPDRAAGTLTDAISTAERSGDLPTLGFVVLQAAELGFERRDPRATQTALDRLIPLAREHGYTLWLAMADALHGWVRAEEGDDDAACTAVRDGFRRWEALGTGLLRPYLFAILATTQRRVGRVGEALASIEAGLAAVMDGGEAIWAPELHRLRGEMLLVRSGHDGAEAEASYVRSLEIARGQDAKLAELRAATSLACLWAGQGERRRAVDLLSPAYAWFTEGFSTLDLRDARTLLDEPRQSGARKGS